MGKRKRKFNIKFPTEETPEEDNSMTTEAETPIVEEETSTTEEETPIAVEETPEVDVENLETETQEEAENEPAEEDTESTEEVCEEENIEDSGTEEGEEESTEEVCEEENEDNLDGDKKEEETPNKTENSSIDYLDMARRIQADFDNYRRHAQEEIKKARIDGQTSVIEIFLPCLDTFKEAKKSIQDENILKGFEMVENKINESLSSLGVVKMDCIGQKYDPHLHNVIAVMRNDEYDNDIILDEYQAGYKLNDKVLRYAKVIVNKKED